MRLKAVITARIGSTRMDRKVLRDLCGIPLLIHVVNRTLEFPEINSPSDIVLAIPDSTENDPLETMGTVHGTLIFRGSEENVLERIIGTANSVSADAIYRITGDNPLVDPGVVRLTYEGFVNSDCDYAVMEDTPLGSTAEIITVNALNRAMSIATKSNNENYIEHPTLPLYENSSQFKMTLISPPEKWNHGDWRFTVDTEADFELVELLMRNLGVDADLDTIVPYIESNPDVLKVNSDISQQGWESLKRRKDAIRDVRI